VRDITQIQAQGLTPAQIEAARTALREMGAGDVTITHPTTTLEDLFVRIVRENTPAGQSSVGSGNA
jgi:ABC-2 type transport system ATP-binding protein